MNRFAALVVLIAVAIVGVFSPLTVWFAAAIVAAAGMLVRGLDADERRRVVAIVAIAVALRLLAIAALFLSADHARVPFAALFGDEAYFINRSLWLRNVALGIPLHMFDLEYAFEPNAASSYVYVLAAIQAIVGPAPYGLHLVSVVLYIGGTLILYRVSRRSFGRAASLFGLVVLLFLPSLFAWSIAVLKEPPFVLLTAASLALAAMLPRMDSWRLRACAILALVALASVLQTLRNDGGAFVLGATILGLIVGFAAARPRLLMVAIVAAPIIAALVLRLPETQLRAYTALQRAARQHWGAVVVSPGVSYKLLDERFYSDVNVTSDLRAGEAGRYVMRGAAAFALLPLPWQTQSAAAAAYIPEQVLWYVIAALALAGITTAFRRDPYVAALLLSYACLIAAGAALTDGNVGTLVRHRSLTLPYLVWFGGIGACDLLTKADMRRL